MTSASPSMFYMKIIGCDLSEEHIPKYAPSIYRPKEWKRQRMKRQKQEWRTERIRHSVMRCQVIANNIYKSMHTNTHQILSRHFYVRLSVFMLYDYIHPFSFCDLSTFAHPCIVCVFVCLCITCSAYQKNTFKSSVILIPQ